MKHMKRLGAFALALALSLSLAACGGSGSGSGSSSGSGADGSDASSSGQQAPAMDLTGITDPFLATAGLAGDTPVATVGGQTITAGQLLYWLNYGAQLYLSQLGAQSQLPWDAEMEGGTFSSQLKDSALETAAFYALLPLKAQEEGLTVSQETLADYTDPDSQNYKEMVEEIRRRLGFTTLRFHRLDDLIKSIGIEPCKLCTYCWNGKG